MLIKICKVVAVKVTICRRCSCFSKWIYVVISGCAWRRRIIVLDLLPPFLKLWLGFRVPSIQYDRIYFLFFFESRQSRIHLNDLRVSGLELFRFKLTVTSRLTYVKLTSLHEVIKRWVKAKEISLDFSDFLDKFHFSTVIPRADPIFEKSQVKSQSIKPPALSFCEQLYTSFRLGVIDYLCNQRHN